VLFVASFIFGRPFITLVYTFVEYDQAVKHDVDPASGYVTPETWSCALAETGSFGSAKSLCTELRVARYLVVPEMVLGACILGAVCWLRLKLKREGDATELATREP
jgi:hypothetical protein